MSTPKVQNWSHFKLLTDIWNQTLKRGSATSHISEDDIVVFIVGPTGSGKSWFTREVTRTDLIGASKDQHPSTEKVQAIRCEIVDGTKTEPRGTKSVVFVDTPSFLTGCDRIDARREIEEWVSKTKFQPLQAGVIYIHRVETDPDLEPIRNHLDELSSIPKIRDGLQRLCFVISYDKASSNISKTKIAERRSKLCKQVDSWNHSHNHSPTRRFKVQEELFQGDPDIAWKIVWELFRI